MTEQWRPYFYKVSPTQKQIVGYLEARGLFTFATVHNTGHMAAGGAKRQQVQGLVYAFINDQKIDLL